MDEAFVLAFSFIFCKLLLLLELLMVCTWGCFGDRCCASGLTGESEVLIFSSISFKLVLLLDVLIASILSSYSSLDMCCQEP